MSTIQDRYGNTIEITYDGESLRPLTAVSKFNNDDEFLAIHYYYDNTLLQYVLVPKYADDPDGGTPNRYIARPTDPLNSPDFLLYEIRYPIDSLELASSGAINTSSFTVNNDAIDFAPLWETNNPGEFAITDQGIRLDLSSVVPAVPSLHVAVDEFEDDPSSLQFESFIVEVTDGSNRKFYRLRGFEQIDDENGNSFGVHAGFNPTSTLVRNQVVRYRYQIDQDDPYNPNDLLLLSPVDDAPAISTPTTLRIYPLIKEGDYLVITDTSFARVLSTSSIVPGSTNRHAYLDAVNSPAGRVRFLTSAGAAQSGQLVRTDNRSRIASIVFPEPEVGNNWKNEIRFTYDDNTVGHQEIKKIERRSRFDTTEKILSSAEYEYERIRHSATREDVEGMRHTEATNRAFYCGMVNPCSGSHKFHYYGIIAEAERNILRKKTVVSKRQDGSDHLNMTTLYGGRYHWTLIGRTTRITWANNPCNEYYWTIDPKNFEFTWQINPDGSGIVYDLSPMGLDIEPLMARYAQRQFVFKTYEFEGDETGGANTSFYEAFQSSFPSHLSWDSATFFEQAPLRPHFNGTTTLSTRGCEEFLAGMEAPSLQNVFDFNAKCFSAQITNYEPIPKYGLQLHQYNSRPDIEVAHGVAYTESTNNRAAFNLFMYHLLLAVPDTNGQRTAAIEQFFDGNRPADTGTSPTSYSFDWTLGPGPVTAPWTYIWNYQNRTALSVLRPNTRMSIAKDAGLAWDSSTQTLDFDEADIVSLTRMSNGGPIATLQITTTKPRGSYPDQSSTIPYAKIIEGAGTALEIGNYVAHHNRLYRITQVTGDHSGGLVTVEPALRHDITAQLNGSSNYAALKVYRYYDGDGAGANAIYRGYDWFGNQTYHAGYAGLGSESLFPQNDPSRRLVPKLDNVIPVSLSWNDADAESNNDTTNWQYFGRVTRSFASSAKGFWTPNGPNWDPPSSNAAANLLRGSVSITSYDTTFPWLPKANVSPARFTIQSPFDNLMAFDTEVDGWTFDTNTDDRVQQFSYYTSAGDKKGMLLQSVSFKGSAYIGSPLALADAEQISAASEVNDFSVQEVDYTYGRPTKQVAASFQSGQAEYAGIANSSYDFPTGVVLAKSQSVANTVTLNGGFLNTSNIYQQSAATFTYDALVRPLTQSTEDGAGTPFGPTSETIYTDPFTTEQSSSTLVPSPQQLSRAVSITDGLGLPLQSRVQFGAGTEEYVQATEYHTDTGRLKQQDVLHRVGEPTGYTVTTYNPRGEPWGSITKTGTNVVAGTWTRPFLTENQNGNREMVVYSETDADGVDPQLTISYQVTDRFGDLVFTEVRSIDLGDYTAGQVLTENHREGDFSRADLVNNSNPAPSEASYSYDRFGNLYHAEVTDGSTSQEREFVFDLAGRLIIERHPEMGSTLLDDDVTYSDFDMFDNPTTIASHDRIVVNAFDAAGRPETSTFICTSCLSQVGEPVEYLHQWIYSSDPAWRFPELPLETLTTATLNTTSGTENQFQVGYRNTYDANRGYLLFRKMLHGPANANASGFPGYIGQQPVENDWANALTLGYIYDNLGRIESTTYPSLNDDYPLTLTYDYTSNGQEQGYVKRMSNANAVLLDQIQRGPNGRFESAQLLGGQQLTKDWDDLSRLDSVDFQSSGVSEQSGYGYALGGRIASIERTRGTVMGTESFKYDVRGQLTRADLIIDGSGSMQPFTYLYDPFGNITEKTEMNPTATQITLDYNSGTNQLTGSTNAVYNAEGEMESFTKDAVDHEMRYDPMGRVARYLNDGNESAYGYDAAGMRFWNSATSDGVGPRLTFYDDQNMALTQWVLRSGQGVTWDRHTVYFDGQSMITLENEANADASSSRAAAPVVTTQAVTTSPSVSWTPVSGYSQYEIELLDGQGNLVKRVVGAGGESYTFGSDVAAGMYNHRVRALGGNWSDPQLVQFATALELQMAGYYQLESDGTDSSLNANHGTISGGTYGLGVVGNAVHMTQNDSFLLTNGQNLPAGDADFTMSLWFNPDETGHGNFPALMTLKNMSLVSYRVANTGVIVVYVNGHNLTGSAITPPNSWHQLTITHNNGVLSSYVNGSLQSSISGVSLNIDSSELRMGRWKYVNFFYTGFAGSFDNLRVYNVALDANQVVQLFESELAPSTFGDYPLDSLVSGNTPDSSVMSNDLQNQGASLVAGFDGSPGNYAFEFEKVEGEEGPGVAERLIDTTPAGLPMGNEPWTAMAWIKPAITAMSGGTLAYTAVSYGAGAGSCDGVAFGLQRDGKMAVRLSCNEYLHLGTPIPNAWTHIAAVYENKVLEMYVDGQMVFTAEVDPLSTNPGPLVVGALDDDKGFVGSIDEVKLYRGALGWTEIQNAANAGSN